MNRTLLIMLAVVAMLNIYAASAMANRVAVLPTIYEDANSGAPDSNAADDFHASILEGVEKTGAELVAREEVALAARSYTTSRICDEMCLEQVRQDIGASEALQVVVKEDREMASRQIFINFARQDSIEQETSDGYAVVKTWLKGAVALALVDTVAQPAEAQPEAQTPAVAPEIGTPIVEREGDTQLIVLKDKPRRKMGPAPMVVAGTTTLMLGIATVVLDQIAHYNFKRIEENLNEIPTYTEQDYEKDMDRLETQQLLTKIFLAATGTALLTTCVFAIFTDYSKFRKNKERVSAALSVGKNTGAVFIGGSF